MKKILCVLLGLCLLCTLAAGCANASKSNFIDLTAMSSTLVFAEVSNIVTNPTAYEGKTVKMGGAYQANFFALTGQYYHCVVVMDATACCPQGLEFEWKGKHKYPGDYPKDGAQIEVTGVFERYEELGRTYYRLAADKLTVLG